jgi:putative sugar O-methyltransferase
MWTHIEQRHQDFMAALDQRDIDRVQAGLGAMFTNDLAYGVARLSPDVDRYAHYTQFRCTDALRSLAEAWTAERVVSLEQQGEAAQRDALAIDLDRLLTETEAMTGLDVGCAPVGSAYGCRMAHRVVNTDSLLHSYTVNRLRQLGATGPSTIVEIGGGYGCLAELAHRAGFRDYSIYDLPWVNVLQGYFLIMTLPPEDVRLYGESRGGMQVLPFWRINDLAPASVDYVINTNSIPEMDAAIAREYMNVIARITRCRFLSINQEGMAPTFGGRQHWVSRLAAEQGSLHCHSRHRWWMEQGYVEEVYGVQPVEG